MDKAEKSLKSKKNEIGWILFQHLPRTAKKERKREKWEDKKGNKRGVIKKNDYNSSN